MLLRITLILLRQTSQKYNRRRKFNEPIILIIEIVFKFKTIPLIPGNRLFSTSGCMECGYLNGKPFHLSQAKHLLVDSWIMDILENHSTYDLSQALHLLVDISYYYSIFRLHNEYGYLNRRSIFG